MSHNGTTFPTVPLNELPAATLSGKSEPYRPVILVVDDESAIADSLADTLKRSGYAAISAYDGEAALETVELMPPELLICAAALPGISGIELALTVMRNFPDCKVILTSSESSSARLMAAAESQGHPFVFLTKPVQTGALLDRVSEAFAGSSQPSPPRSSGSN